MPWSSVAPDTRWADPPFRLILQQRQSPPLLLGSSSAPQHSPTGLKVFRTWQVQYDTWTSQWFTFTTPRCHTGRLLFCDLAQLHCPQTRVGAEPAERDDTLATLLRGWIYDTLQGNAFKSMSLPTIYARVLDEPISGQILVRLELRH